MEDQEYESKLGKICKISGPLVVAQNMSESQMYQLVKVGHDKLLGEIIRLEGDLASIQCYGETTGLIIGDPITNTRSHLSVELGPGLMEEIFDGIQRPLEVINEDSTTSYVLRGIDVPCLNRNKEWLFVPNKMIKKDSNVYGGDVIGYVRENDIFNEHKIMLHPKEKGRVKEIQPEGNYTINDVILELELDNSKQTRKITMSQLWPVRQPRPVAEKLQVLSPMLTGQRILDTIFPCVLGGTCAIPNSFGTKHTTIAGSISKYSINQAIVYVGCGQLESELTKVLDIFNDFSFIQHNTDYTSMMKSVLIANTSNTPVAIREASIYTGMTIAEYLRDMGYNTAIMADSISKWSEALREISCHLDEIPGDLSYEQYSSNRIAQFIDRSGSVRCYGSPDRAGSITIIGAVTPPVEQFSDSVSKTFLENSKVYWGLDHKLFQIKHFPNINWFTSYSNYEKTLEPFFINYDPDFVDYKNTIMKILQDEKIIIETVDQDSLTEIQKLILTVAKNIREDFLAQNAYCEYDYTCPLEKTIGMMKCIVTYFNNAIKAIKESSDENKRTFAYVHEKTYNEHYDLFQMKFILPHQEKSEIIKKFNEKKQKIDDKFKKEFFS